MNKRIAYYTLADSLDVWDDTIRQLLDKQISKHGVISFEDGSAQEIEFQKNCSERSISVERKTILKCTGKDLFKHPYHYLTVKPDKSIYDEKSFMDRDRVCAGGGSVLCNTGARQTNKVTIDLKKSKHLDIMTVPNIHKPKIHVISRKLKEVFESTLLKGYRMVPCLVKGNTYTEDEMKLESESKRLAEEASYFQLIVEGRVKSPPCAGTVTKVFSQCPTCGTVYGFYSDTTPYFSKDDLENTDFQLFDEYISSEGRRFSVAGEIIIVSAKVLQLLIDQKNSGLASYLTDPPIKHGVVDFVEH